MSPRFIQRRELTSDTEVSINDRFGIEEGTVYNSFLCCEEVFNSIIKKFTMQSLVLLCFAALVACAHAKYHYQRPPPGFVVGHPDAAFYFPRHKHGRHPRDLTWGSNVGKGRVFGTLGSTDDSLFGRGGYKQDIFNDHRGRLQGVAYGKRVLGAGGDSSILGGKLNWNNANDNVRAGLDVHKEIGRGSGFQVNGDGVWKLDHNTRLVGGGNLHKNFGHDRPEFGIQGAIEHDF